MRFYFLLAYSLFFTSCASFLNGSFEKINVISDDKYIIKSESKDDVKEVPFDDVILVRRNIEPLIIEFYKDSSVKTISIPPKKSIAYYSNIYFNLGLGMLIDKNSAKQFSYPQFIYSNANDSVPYYTYQPVNRSYKNYKNVIGITPLKIIGLAEPGVEVYYQRRWGNRMATSVHFTYLLSMMQLNQSGYKYGFEHKFYLRESAFKPYLSIFGEVVNKQIDQNQLFLKNGISRDSLTIDNFEDHVYSDSFSALIEMTRISPKIGFEYKISNKWLVDGFIGIGVKERSVVHEGRYNSDDDFLNIGLYTNSLKEREIRTITIPMNLRIGYQF